MRHRRVFLPGETNGYSLEHLLFLAVVRDVRLRLWPSEIMLLLAYRLKSRLHSKPVSYVAVAGTFCTYGVAS